jgi:hypothetical protein
VDPITLQQLLDTLADPDGDVAALLSGAAGQATNLADLESQAMQAFDDLRASDSLSADDLAQLETLADAVEQIREEQGRRDAVAAEQRARVEELAQRVGGEDGEGDPDGDSGDTDPDAGDGGDTDPENQPAGQPGEGQPAEGQPPADAPAEGAERETVAAAGTDPAGGAPGGPPARRPAARVDLARIARARPQPPAPANQRHPAGQLLAAADVPGVSAGAEFSSWTDIAEAARARFAALPARGSEGRMRAGLVTIRKNVDEALIAPGSDDLDVIEHAASERRLDGGSLVAAGGWCAPSETLYDLCELETSDGLVDVPEIVAARGGIRWTPGPDFATIYSAVGFIQTEAQAIAGTTKPCYEVPCPDFDEERLDAIGVCVSAGILQQRAYPELVQRTLRGTMTAHAHKYSASTIARIEAGSTAVTTPGGPGATASVLGAIELQAADYRYRHRMDDGATMELIAPRWIRGVLRSDLAKRNGVDMLNITDAQITAYFRSRGVNPQFVYNWQDAFIDAGVGMGAAAPPVGWPESVKFLMYAAGTWVRATSDIITLDAVYDSTLFRVNKYNALFSEEGLAMIKRCFDSRVITVPYCPDGATGAQVAVDCAAVTTT